MERDMMHQTQHIVSPEESPVAALFHRHARILLAYIRPQVHTKEEAEDLLVEVFLVVMQKETPWHLSESEQLTWLRRVAHNKIVDRYRRLGRLPATTSLEGLSEVLLDDEERLPEALALRNADAAQLRRHLASLSQMQQEILRLRFANGL